MEDREKPDSGAETHKDGLSQGSRVAAAATVLTVLLAVVKGAVGQLRHSPALSADAVHSGADALAIFASWFGLKLAQRPATKRFPFGLYRAETLASLLASLVILLAGVHLLIEGVGGLIRGAEPPSRSVEVLIVAIFSAVISFGIFVWERGVGKRLDSQSLLANADESRADVLTSTAVFTGAGASYLGVGYLELIVTVGLALLILWLGGSHGRLAVYALLDASLDPALEEKAKAIAEGIGPVKRVEQMRLRRAGPFKFGMAHIQVAKSIDVARGHKIAHQVSSAIRNEIPHIEMLTVHLEPFEPTEQVVMVPAEGETLDAQVSEHFGRATHFCFAKVSPEGFGDVEWEANPFGAKKARAGLTLIKDVLTKRHVDAVLTHEMGEIAYHALRDNYVEIYHAPVVTVEDALRKLAGGELDMLGKPTHPSEAKGAPERSP